VVSGTARLIAIGAIAVALGFGVGSAVRSGSDHRALPDYPAKMTSEPRAPRADAHRGVGTRRSPCGSGLYARRIRRSLG
jgi:hypothetical protein